MGKFMTQKSPKSTLFADNTQGLITTKQTAWGGGVKRNILAEGATQLAKQLKKHRGNPSHVRRGFRQKSQKG